jgi:hypothetical protein
MVNYGVTLERCLALVLRSFSEGGCEADGGNEAFNSRKKAQKAQKKRAKGKKADYSEALPLLLFALFVPFRGYSLFLLPLRPCVRFSVFAAAARPCKRGRSRRRSTIFTPSLV